MLQWAFSRIPLILTLGSCMPSMYCMCLVLTQVRYLGMIRWQSGRTTGNYSVQSSGEAATRLPISSCNFSSIDEGAQCYAGAGGLTTDT